MQQGQATDKYGISTIPGWTLVYRPPPPWGLTGSKRCTLYKEWDPLSPEAALGQNDTIHYIETG